MLIRRRLAFSPLFCGLFLAIVFGYGSSAEELTADRLLAPDRVTEIKIELAPEDWRALCQQTRDMRTAFSGKQADPFTYFKADITIDGVTIKSVGVRKKGFLGSLDNRYPSLKVKFDEYVEQNPVPGLDVLTLNNNKQDTALVSQFLTYRLFNAAGVHAPRVNFARVTVNGEYLGIYSNVETLGKPFLKRRYGDDTGRLYEGTLADFYPSAIDRLEAKHKTPDDRAKILRLAQLIAAKEELDLVELEKVLDLEKFLRFWALESLLGFWDGYSNNQNNYWVYENPKNGKLYFMPWGADAAFTQGFGFGFGPRRPVSVYAESMLTNRLYRAPGVADRYRETMRQLLTGVWKEEELVQEIDRLEALLKDHLHERQAGAPRAMTATRQFIRSRREAITKELDGAWPVSISPQPRKPAYTVPVGAAQGTFATTWSQKPSPMQLESSRAEVQLQLDGKPMTLKDIRVAAHMMQIPAWPGGPPGAPRPPRPPQAGAPNDGPRPPQPPQPPGAPGDAPRPPQPPGEGPRLPQPPVGPRPPQGPPGGPFGQFQPPAQIILTGVRESDGKKVTITFTVDPKALATSAGKTINADGSLSEGETVPFLPFAARAIEGKLTFAKAGTNPGDAIEGKFDIQIVESRGGIFAPRPGGFGPGGPPRGPGQPGGPRPPGPGVPPNPNPQPREPNAPRPATP